MQSIINEWTSQMTGIVSPLLLFVAAVGVVVIIVIIVRGILSTDDRSTGETVIKIVMIVLFLLVAVGATTLVNGIIPA